MIVAIRDPHFHTQARLRPASSADVPALAALHRSYSRAPAMSDASWLRAIGSRAEWVTVATEHGVVIGATVELHRPRSAVARLSWLGVTSSARKGVDRLLLNAVIARAQSEGAAVLRVMGEVVDPVLRNLLNEAGFLARAHHPGGTAEFRKSLWDSDGDTSHLALGELRYEQSENGNTGVRCLMMAVAAIDNGDISRLGVERDVHDEILGDSLHEPGDEPTTLAVAAARHGLRVTLYRSERRETGTSAPIDATRHSTTSLRPGEDLGSIAFVDGLPRAEHLVGHLWRGDLPMLRGCFPRLHQEGCNHWLLVIGFDGFLFEIADPELSTTVDPIRTEVTLAEMRACLTKADQMGSAALVLSRRRSGIGDPSKVR